MKNIRVTSYGEKETARINKQPHEISQDKERVKHTLATRFEDEEILANNNNNFHTR